MAKVKEKKVFEFVADVKNYQFKHYILKEGADNETVTVYNGDGNAVKTYKKYVPVVKYTRDQPVYHGNMLVYVTATKKFTSNEAQKFLDRTNHSPACYFKIEFLDKDTPLETATKKEMLEILQRNAEHEGTAVYTLDEYNHNINPVAYNEKMLKEKYEAELEEAKAETSKAKSVIEELTAQLRKIKG